MNELEFPVHKQGKTALTITAVLMMLLCFTFPVAIYMLVRLQRMRVRVTSSGVEAYGWFMTDTVNFDDVERFGLLRSPVVAGGIGGYLARMKLGHMNEGINLVFKLKSGKNVTFITNQYERHQELIDRVTQALRVPREDIQMGLLSWKWPEKA